MIGAHRLRRAFAVLIAVPTLALAAACGGSSASNEGPATTLRLGYFANVTHAAALVGVDKGFLKKDLGKTELTTQIFDAGPAEVEALFGGALDAAYVGPNPAINAYGQSDGEAVRVIAGATSGGAQLIVRPGINTPQDLKGKTLATPQLGNTQDVALRAWLSKQGLKNSVQGGGDVTISPTKNSDTLQLFKSGKLDGAWVPEPWASRLVVEGGGKLLVDERSLWPQGKFATTLLVVRTAFLQQHPQTVEALLRGHVEAVQWANQNPDQAKTLVNDSIGTLTGTKLKTEVIDRAWQDETVTNDPIAPSLQKSANDAVAAGVSKDKVDLNGIFDLTALNRILTQQGQPTVSSGGLGKQ
jgi:NitT/TauT family transport system substrate-binding protein